MQDLIEQFSVDGISKSPSIFDETKMKWLNGRYIKELTPAQFVEKARAFLDASAVNGKYDYEKIAKLLIPRVETFGEIAEKVAPLEKFEAYDPAMFEHKKMKITLPIAYSSLLACREVLPSVDDWTDETLKAVLNDLAVRLGVKTGQVFLPLRLAITGAATTPGGATEMAELFGKEETLKRLDFSIDLLSKAVQ